MVYFGGTDTYNLAPRTLAILCNSKYSHFDIDLVVGVQSHCYPDVLSVSQSHTNINVHTFVPSLASLIASADFAIGALGTTSWERICLRLYALVVSLADNQLSLANLLASNNFIHYIGHASELTDEALALAIDQYLSNSTSSQIPYGLVDGYGCHRFVSAVVGPAFPISLREAVELDEFLLFSWTNEPSVRSNCLSTDLIPFEDHCSWFASVLSSSNRLLLIAEDSFKCPVAQLRYDISQCQRSSLFSFSIDPAFRGFKLSPHLLRLSLDYLSEYCPSVTTIRAQVKHHNYARFSLLSVIWFCSRIHYR